MLFRTINWSWWQHTYNIMVKIATRSNTTKQSFINKKTDHKKWHQVSVFKIFQDIAYLFGQVIIDDHAEHVFHCLWRIHPLHNQSREPGTAEGQHLKQWHSPQWCTSLHLHRIQVNYDENWAVNLLWWKIGQYYQH